MKPAAAADADRPAPRRLRGWKLALVGVVALLLLLIFAHAVWTAVERNAVERRLSALRAANLPVDAKDLVAVDVADADNLVVPLRAAIDALVPESPERQDRRREIEGDDTHAFDWPLTDAEAAFAREGVEANAAALAAIADVDGRTGVAWPPPPTGTPLMTVVDPAAKHARDVANLLGDAAYLAARDGRSTDALVAIGRIAKVGDAIGGKPQLIASLVGVGAHAMAAQRAIDVAQTLDASAHDAMRELIRAFLNDAAMLRIARGGLNGERVFLHDTFSAIRGGRLALTGIGGPPTAGQQMAAAALAPVLYRSEGALLDVYAEGAAILDAPDQSAYDARSGPLDAAGAATQSGPMTLFASVFGGAPKRWASSTYRATTDRHLAAVVLAIRLYQLDHAGQRPAALDTLVPDYLPAVPSDAIDGKPLRYDATRAIVWCVGEDGIDNGGDETPRRPARERDRWQTKDGVVHLDARPRPATEPSE